MISHGSTERVIRARREKAERDRAEIEAQRKADQREKRQNDRKMIIFGTIRIIKGICYFILALAVLSALTAHDIAMFFINMKNDCTLGTEDGKSQYVNFTLSTWMYCASIVQFSIFCVSLFGTIVNVYVNQLIWEGKVDGKTRICCCSISDIVGDLMGVSIFIISCLGSFFLLAWAVIGCLLRREIQKHGVNNQQCDDVLLAWLIINLVPVAFAVCSYACQ